MRRLICILLMCLWFAPERQRPSASPAHASAPMRPAVKVDLSAALPSSTEFATLARTDAVAMLKACVMRYGREIKGYNVVMQKQERIGRKLGHVEVIEVNFRDDPHSVFMNWRTDSLGGGDRVLFVEGEHNNQLVVRPKGALARAVAGKEVLRDPEGREAKQAGRVSLREFGIRKATERTIAAWEAAQKAGRLNVEYRGIKEIPDAGNRPCHVLVRTCDPPEEDGLVSVEINIDVEKWLQVGSVLKDKNGKLIGAYYFRDLELNPDSPGDQFDRSVVSR